MEKELTRETVDPRYTWDLTRIYASDEAWEEAFVTIKAQADAFAQRAGTLNKGRESILETLAAMAKMDEEFEALYVYAMMKNNEDSTKRQVSGDERPRGHAGGRCGGGKRVYGAGSCWPFRKAKSRR